jgi:ABC-type Fe3+-siderophore transport system permease subunit
VPPSTAIGTAGVALLLLAFLLQLLGRLRAEDPAYLGLNLAGAALAALASWLIRFLPFVVLEGTWALVAAAGLVRVARSRRRRA